MIASVILDLDGVLSDFTSAATRLFGFSPEQYPMGQPAVWKALNITEAALNQAQFLRGAALLGTPPRLPPGRPGSSRPWTGFASRAACTWEIATGLRPGPRRPQAAGAMAQPARAAGLLGGFGMGVDKPAYWRAPTSAAG